MRSHRTGGNLRDHSLEMYTDHLARAGFTPNHLDPAPSPPRDCPGYPGREKRPNQQPGKVAAREAAVQELKIAPTQQRQCMAHLATRLSPPLGGLTARRADLVHDVSIPAQFPHHRDELAADRSTGRLPTDSTPARSQEWCQALCLRLRLRPTGRIRSILRPRRIRAPEQ